MPASVGRPGKHVLSGVALPGEYDWTICAQRRCGLTSSYFVHFCVLHVLLNIFYVWCIAHLKVNVRRTGWQNESVNSWRQIFVFYVRRRRALHAWNTSWSINTTGSAETRHTARHTEQDLSGHMLRGISFHGAPTPELDYGRGTHKSSRMAASSSVSGSVDTSCRCCCCCCCSSSSSLRLSSAELNGYRRQRHRGCRGRDPQYLTCRCSFCVDNPHNILTSVLFFPFSGTWNGFASLYRSLGTNWYFYKVYHTTTIYGTHES